MLTDADDQHESAQSTESPAGASAHTQAHTPAQAPRRPGNKLGDKLNVQPAEVPPALAGDPLHERLRTEALSLDVLSAMRRAGLEKPPGTPWSHWLGVKRLRYKHENMALMFAAGRTQNDVATAFGYTVSRVSIIANSPVMRMRVSELRSQFFGEQVASQFKAMMEPAQKVFADVLGGQGSLGLRAKVAEQVFNRVLGKPKETLEVSNRNITDVFALLDSMKRGENILDITPGTGDIQSMPRDFGPSPAARSVSLNPVPAEASQTYVVQPARSDDPYDAIDKWVAKLNAPADTPAGTSA